MFKNLIDKGKCKLGFHAGEWVYSSKINCEQVQVCTRCQTESRRVAHTWNEWRYEAEGACTLTHVCNRCREAERKVEHSWGEWAYINRYACSQGRSCLRCGHKYDRTQTTHQWPDWEFSDYYAGPARVCRRCGELAKPGSSGKNPFDEELRLIVNKLLATDSWDEIQRILNANEKALFSKNAWQFLQGVKRQGAGMAGTPQRLENLQALLERCAAVGINAGVQEQIATSTRTSTPTHTTSTSRTPTTRPSRTTQTNPNIDPRLVGQWETSHYESAGSSAALYSTLVDLYQEGTFRQQENTVYAGSSAGSTGYRETGRGRWRVQKGMLYLIYNNGNQIFCRYANQGNRVYCRYPNGLEQEWKRA